MGTALEWTVVMRLAQTRIHTDYITQIQFPLEQKPGLQTYNNGEILAAPSS